MALRLHYYNLTANFGDALCPLLIEKLSGRSIVYSHPCSAELVAVGSVLFSGSALFLDQSRLVSVYGVGKLLLKVIDAFRTPLNIWGSGFLFDPGVTHAIPIRKTNVHAIRGKKSLEILRRTKVICDDRTVALGDPGLLYPMLLDKIPIKTHDLGIVPHFRDWEDGLLLGRRFESIGVKVKIINVLQDEPVNVLREISQCDKILSSSLHGLIVADALQIPNLHIVFSTLGQDKNEFLFKFHDYYSAFNAKDDGIIDGRGISNPIDLIKMITKVPKFPLDQILERQESLKLAFPFKK